MVRWTRTAAAQDGKEPQAFEWAVRVAKYVSDNFAGAQVLVLRNLSGPIFQIHWVVDYESLADLERVLQQVEGDAGYQDLLTESRDADLFDSRTVVDNYYISIG